MRGTDGRTQGWGGAERLRDWDTEQGPRVALRMDGERSGLERGDIKRERGAEDCWTEGQGPGCVGMEVAERTDYQGAGVWGSTGSREVRLRRVSKHVASPGRG